MKDESEVQQLIQIEAAKFGVILLRNNSGAMKDDTGRVVRYGLGNISPKQETKSSDLIGITTIVITPQMVGKTVGIFTAVEVKKEGWTKITNERERHQSNFLTWVAKRGGIAFFANSVETFKANVARWMNDSF